jgi:thymidylate kinase
MATPRLISVSGIDGSGKTTIIDALSVALRANGGEVRVIWLRFNHYTVKTVLAFARLFRFTTFEQYPGGQISYHEFYRSRLLSHAFILLTWFDTALATLFTVRLPLRRANTIIICDRWIPDILIDLEIDTRMGLRENSRYHRMFWWLVPDWARLLVIDRGFDDVLHTRPEHPYDRNFEIRFELYKTLARHKGLNIIDNTGFLNAAIRQTLEILN